MFGADLNSPNARCEDKRKGCVLGLGEFDRLDAVLFTRTVVAAGESCGRFAVILYV